MIFDLGPWTRTERVPSQAGGKTPLTGQQIALRGLRREMTESSHPYWLVEVATNPKEGDQPWNANSGLNCTVW